MKRTAVFLLLPFLMLAACGPTQGYVGPELPAEKVALVKPSFDSSLSLERAVADGFTFSSSGITLLPGKHLFSLSLEFEEPPFDCDYYSTFDSSGYRQCLRDEWKEDKDGRRYRNKTCECRDYITVRSRCQKYVTDESCSIELDTIAGREYRLEVAKRGERTTVTSYDLAGSAKPLVEDCVSSGRRIETDDEYVGTGTSASYRYGYFSCY